MAKGYAITVGGANFASVRRGIDLDVQGAAEGLFLFGGTEAESAKNWVKDKPNGIWTGAPTLTANEAGFDPASKYLTTGIADATDMTWIMAVRSDAPLGLGNNDPLFAATNTGTSVVGARSIFGLSLRVEADSGGLTLFVPRYTGVASANQTTGLSAVNSPPMTEWSIIAARFSNTMNEVDDVLRAKNITAAASVNRDLTTNKIRIGGRYGTPVGSGSMRSAGALFASRYYSDQELILASAQLKRLLEQRGIVFP